MECHLCNVRRFKPYWVPVAKMYNATASSNGLSQGGHRGLARVKALPDAASLATPAHYESDSYKTESDDTESIESDATYSSDGSASGAQQQGRGNRSGIAAGVILAFCIGAIVGAFAYSSYEKRTQVPESPTSELIERNHLLHMQSSVSQSPHS